jgi:hypothetical protein
VEALILGLLVSGDFLRCDDRAGGPCMLGRMPAMSGEVLPLFTIVINIIIRYVVDEGRLDNCILSFYMVKEVSKYMYTAYAMLAPMHNHNATNT